MAAFLKAKGVKGRALKRELAELGLGGDEGTTEPRLLDARPALEADLAWQVRALGRRVLAAARQRLAHRYPTYAAFRALKPGGRPFEARPPALLAPDAEGNTDVGPLNTELDAIYLKDPRNPRWVKTPTVAYLWARTVRCKGCRATIPLLKTRWLAKKGAKRVRLTMAPNAESTGVVFGLEVDVPTGEDNPRAAARARPGGWRTLFTNRQLLALGMFVQEIRRLPESMADWPQAWREATVTSLTPTISRLADRGSTLATWTNDPGTGWPRLARRCKHTQGTLASSERTL